MKEKLFGKGTNSKGKFRAKLRGKNTNEYQVWRDMLRRCYCKKILLKKPSYNGCTVASEFLEFQNFADWATHQIGYGLEGYHLDKDILVPNNKEYNSVVCVFVPKELNMFLTNNAAKRGMYPQGVSWKTTHNKFVAQIKNFGIVQHLGLFDNLDCAMGAYALAKTKAGRLWAERLKNGCYSVDSRVISIMENYQFYYEERK